MVSAARRSPELVQRVQEIPYDDPHSRFFFRKDFVSTRAALDTFGIIAILACHQALIDQARRCNGIDYLQVFEDHANPHGPNLWFIEDAEYVTALLPSDY